MNLEETRSLEYFRIRTIPQLSGFLGSSFWSHYLLQTAAHEPAIRHAIIALGSLHERFEAGDSSILRSNLDKLEGGFALQQYTTAIGQLIKPSFNHFQQTLDVALTACVLFTCFETLRGHHGSALSHVANGVRMLRELPEDYASTQSTNTGLAVANSPHVPYDTLQVIFARFDSQSMQLGAANGPGTFYASQEVEPGFRDTVPPAFSTLVEARNAMDYQERNQGWFFYTLISGHIITGEQDVGRRYLLNKMECWRIALDKFIQNTSELTIKDKTGMKILQLRCLFNSLLLSITDLADEMMWDQHAQIFSHILDLASEVIKEAAAVFALNGTHSPIFQIDVGLVAPVFETATKCRDPVIRRRAITLLRVAPRQEGVWDGVLASRVAERLMQLEEQGRSDIRSCADIPREARIGELDVRWDLQERKARLIYTRHTSISRDLQTIGEEEVTW
ncbi:MAG: hypothetical protein Q9165_006786 [Trypethelium subeluteriae]